LNILTAEQLVPLCSSKSKWRCVWFSLIFCIYRMDNCEQYWRI